MSNSMEKHPDVPDSGGQESSGLETSGITIIIPMKPLSDSKSRLSKNFSREEREDLALGMLRRVIGAVQASSIGPFRVVGRDQRVRKPGTSVGLNPPANDQCNSQYM